MIENIDNIIDETINDEEWQLIDKEDKDAEKIERPSLTFLQDGWRRLKSNKIAMISMAFIFFLVAAAIFVPMLWKYSYEDQILTFSNIPPLMKIQKLEGDRWVYVTSEYTVVEVTEKGELIGLLDPVKKDPIEKKNIYDLDGKNLTVDYSSYTKALLEYRKLEKEADKNDTDMVEVNSAEYLKEYFEDKDKDVVDILEAKKILDNDLERCKVTYEGSSLTESKNVWNKTYILGSDGLGRDLFIRIVYGARMSLMVGIFAAIVNFAIGVFYGSISGYIGGKLDNLMMRFVDALSSIPMMLYVILIMVIVGPGLKSIILALGATYWVGMARIVRGQVLSLKQQEFILAAKTLGASTGQILVKHLIPNMMGPIMVSIAMQIPSAIFTEAFLSFVGLGISAPQASWGTLCNDALAGIYVNPYQMLFPAIAISVTILAFNLFSDGLRDAFDPKQRK